MIALPAFAEFKRRLDGAWTRYDCELVERLPDVVRLRYRLPRAWRVRDVDLPAGTVTLAHYWIDRPFNLYQWVDAHGRTLGCYFNLASPAVVEDRALTWTDWFLDVLVRPRSAPEILDRDDLPPSLPPAMAIRIEAALAALLAEIDERVAEAESARARLLPVLLAPVTVQPPPASA